MRRTLAVVILFTLLITGCAAQKADKAKEDTNNTNKTAETQSDENLPKFTLDELKKYDGSNGKIYVGYSGKVYDVTDVKGFATGKTAEGHKSLYGKDMTSTIHLSPHGGGPIRQGKVVGILVK